MAIVADVQSLSPGAIVEMFEVDATALGDTIYYFHAGTNELRNDLVWQTKTYVAFPVEVSGFELTTNGQLPRPTLRIANITGLMGALLANVSDLIGAKVTRRRTLVKYLDAVNFAGGINPTADPNQHFNDDIYFVNRKVNENKVFVELELASSLDVQGVKLPRRQIIQNVCPWVYRSAECSYAGGAVADATDTPTSILANDRCGKRLVSCKLRFGTYATLPYGGFPGSAMI